MVITPLILVVFVLAWPEPTQWLPSEYFGGVSLQSNRYLTHLHSQYTVWKLERWDLMTRSCIFTQNNLKQPYTHVHVGGTQGFPVLFGRFGRETCTAC
jgi:hypothetical protein